MQSLPEPTDPGSCHLTRFFVSSPTRYNISLLVWVPPCQAEGHVRRIASELEALQDNAAEFGAQKTGLAGRCAICFNGSQRS